jgi:N-acetylglucosaminyl-diphospho-decaprenol L-rhamnosyltransferase
MIPVRVDAVVVSYRSADTLRACVEPLARMDGLTVTVVDNASPDRSLEAVADLPVRAIAAGRNAGFAAGCNLGAAGGVAPYVLLLNPDLRLGEADVAALVAVLDADPRVGLVGPRLLDGGGSLIPSQRRFPRLASTWAQALFLHRIAPHAPWADEVVLGDYDRPAACDWVSGACMLVRRDALERIGGLDEGFFLYSEDTDVCRRLRALGLQVRYEPGATVHHAGGASAPRDELLATLAASRVRYARVHQGRATAALTALALGVGATIRLVGRPRTARGHAAVLRALITQADPVPRRLRLAPGEAGP